MRQTVSWGCCFTWSCSLPLQTLVGRSTQSRKGSSLPRPLSEPYSEGMYPLRQMGKLPQDREAHTHGLDGGIPGHICKDRRQLRLCLGTTLGKGQSVLQAGLRAGVGVRKGKRPSMLSNWGIRGSHPGPKELVQREIFRTSLKSEDENWRLGSHNFWLFLHKAKEAL